MKLNINGMDVSLTDLNHVTAGNKAKYEAKGIRLTDGTALYITAYKPVAGSEGNNGQGKATAKPPKKKNEAATAATGLDMNALVQAVMAAMAANAGK
jgi:uncharacterized Fe-S center protein